MRHRAIVHTLLACSSMLASASAMAQTSPVGDAQPAQTDPSVKTPSTTAQFPTTTPDASTAAQTVPNTTAQAAPADASNGDIIVTAQRRDESLSKTPVAVAVISADTLVKAQVVSEQDLRTATPGLSVRAGLSSNQLNFSLRGQSQDAYSATRPGVLPYINEVQIGGNGGSTAFYDLQSVQVLKGPQGTLFGRSATGGAVLFTTAKPTDEFGGYISVLGGNYNARKAEGAINLPLSGDQLMLRVAGFYKDRDGFQKNIFRGGAREGDLKRYGGRGSLTANFGASLHNDLVVDYLHSKGSNTIGVISGLLPLAAPGTPPYIPIQLLYAGTATPTATATGEGTVAAFTGAPSAAVNPFYLNYFAQPGHNPNGIVAELAAQQARGPYVVDTDGRNVFRDRNLIVTNTTSLDLGPDTVIKNIFGYTRLISFLASDADGTPFGVSQNAFAARNEGTGQDYFTRQVSNELQLQGKAINNDFTYVLGGYFSNEKTISRTTSQFFDILFGGNSVANGNAQINDYAITNKTYAGYGQGTYSFGDSGLAVTGGLRYTSEKVGKLILSDDSARLALGTPAPAGFSYDQSRKFNRLSYQLGLQDQITDSTLLYAVTRRAYKSGGFNGLVSPKVGGADVAGDAYRAERVSDAELGSKFKGHLGGMPTRLNLALFYNWVRDSQRTAFTLVGASPAALTVNVPKAKIYGAEVDGQISPARWLEFGGNFNYTHSKFGADTVFANGLPFIFDQVPDTPKKSGSIYANVTIPVSGDISFLLHGDAYGQDKAFTTSRSQNNVGTVLPGYVLANFRVGVDNDKAGWSLTANLKNAFNRTYFVGVLPTGELYQINVAVPGDPRTFTVEARFKF